MWRIKSVCSSDLSLPLLQPGLLVIGGSYRKPRPQLWKWHHREFGTAATSSTSTPSPPKQPNADAPSATSVAPGHIHHPEPLCRWRLDRPATAVFLIRKWVSKAFSVVLFLHLLNVCFFSFPAPSVHRDTLAHQNEPSRRDPPKKRLLEVWLACSVFWLPHWISLGKDGLGPTPAS